VACEHLQQMTNERHVADKDCAAIERIAPPINRSRITFGR
jgi:hypothetical protein